MSALLPCPVCGTDSEDGHPADCYRETADGLRLLRRARDEASALRRDLADLQQRQSVGEHMPGTRGALGAALGFPDGPLPTFAQIVERTKQMAATLTQVEGERAAIAESEATWNDRWRTARAERDALAAQVAGMEAGRSVAVAHLEVERDQALADRAQVEGERDAARGELRAEKDEHWAYAVKTGERLSAAETARDVALRDLAAVRERLRETLSDLADFYQHDSPVTGRLVADRLRGVIESLRLTKEGT